MFIIGITGGSASGKSTFVRELAKICSNNIQILALDNYYKDKHKLHEIFVNDINYDHPDAFDYEKYMQDINDLKNGKSVYVYQYDYAKHCKGDVAERIEPCKILLLDGLLLFYNKKIRDICDLKIFIDTDDEIRLNRRIARDINNRGREKEDIINQYINFVRPMYEKYTEPTKRYADMIINGNNINMSVYEIFKHYFMSILH